MSNDPLAVPSALRQLTHFLEGLAADLQARRGPLQTALDDRLLFWDVNPGRHELAARLAVAGAAVRGAGLAGHLRGMHQRRAADPIPGADGFDPYRLALYMLDCATAGNRPEVDDRLDRLHRDQPALLPGVGDAVRRAAGVLLVAWCGPNAADFGDRFRAERDRLGLTWRQVDTWHDDADPGLSGPADAVLFALLHAGGFAVGRLDDPLDDHLRGDAHDHLQGDGAGDLDDTGADRPARPPAKKRPVPKAEAAVLVRDWLAKYAEPDPGSVTARMVAAGTGVSAGAVAQSAPWRAFQQERTKRQTGTVRTVPLTDDMLAAVPARPDDRDAELARLIAEQEADDTDRWEPDDPPRPARRERSRRS